jgi:hypothetical protein
MKTFTELKNSLTAAQEGYAANKLRGIRAALKGKKKRERGMNQMKSAADFISQVKSYVRTAAEKAQLKKSGDTTKSGNEMSAFRKKMKSTIDKMIPKMMKKKFGSSDPKAGATKLAKAHNAEVKARRNKEKE